MPDHTAIQFGNQRYRKRLGGTQRLNDELLRVVADPQGVERCDRKVEGRAAFGVSLSNAMLCLTLG